jgi:hypothetical protein
MEDREIQELGKRKSRVPERFTFEAPVVREKKHHKPIQPKKTPSETAIAYGVHPFQKMLSMTLESLDLSESRQETRSVALRQTLYQAMDLVVNNHVTTTKNGEYLVTSKEKDHTYQVRSVPLGEQLHFTCNCGRSFGIGDRVTCKHIFAVVMSTLNHVVSLFFQVSTKQSVQDMNDLCQLMSHVRMKKVFDDQEEDSFSQLLKTTL